MYDSERPAPSMKVDLKVESGDAPMYSDAHIVHVEICQRSKSGMKKSVLEEVVKNAVESGTDLKTLLDGDLFEAVDSIRFGGVNGDVSNTPPGNSENRIGWQYHVYKVDTSGGQLEDIEEEKEENSVHAAKNWILPSADFEGLWESLVFDAGVKESLLSYVEVTMLLSERGVDPNLVTWNRVVLFHGPPGTGKTSLCQALSHKLCLRLGSRFDYGHLVEINSHSLFSKWFSESGKLVQRMFETIEGLVDDPRALVCVLIDEVESLAAARNRCGNEPSDATRVVNAVLTQLDNIKRLKNVLILTTSNVTGMIDLAFVDRADLKKYIGPPSAEAAYGILRGSALELMKKRIVAHDNICADFKKLAAKSQAAYGQTEKLISIAEKCAGLSGRTLRKLPFLAMVKAGVGSGGGLAAENIQIIPSDVFFGALDSAVDEELADRKKLDK